MHDNLSYRAQAFRLFKVSLITFSLVSGPLWALDIATLEFNKTYPNEISLVLTNQTLQQNMDKNFAQIPCKPRIISNGQIQENYFLKSCRAHVTKFLLDSGYEMKNWRTFVK